MLEKLKALFSRTGGNSNEAAKPESEPERPLKTEPLEILPHCGKAESRELEALSLRCEAGDASAMAELARYLRGRDNMEGWARFWLLRAAIYGDKASQKELLRCQKENPAYLSKLPIHLLNNIPGRRYNWHNGDYEGELLNAAGLLMFKPEESYLLAGINEERFMVAWEFDEFVRGDDGFGDETYYHMFCLDEFYAPIPGVPLLHSVTSRDIDTIDKRAYDNMLTLAREQLAKRPKRELWLDFVKE